jgi:hypothetical protein
MGLHQIKSFLHSKRIDEHSEWKKIFTRDSPDKGIISRIYKEFKN